MAEGYLRHHDFQVRDDNRNGIHARREDYTVSLRFDDRDHVIALSRTDAGSPCAGPV
ncbi:hypothetical protein [Streptomyces sp. CB02400]|uniref:hypothetical protein n=1 Tax=unclassified Streptomyces TaxID=2593676 RepID=UPI00130180AF|nr:hypothetical protein [Streptomyces sp. CB02400]